MRILLADDQPKVRFALRTLLERKLGLEIVGEAADMRDMWEQVETSCPDLLLLDWELPGPKARDLMSALHAMCPDLRVIAMSAHTDVQQDALQADVDGFVCKCAPPDSLLAAIGDLATDADDARNGDGPQGE